MGFYFYYSTSTPVSVMDDFVQNKLTEWNLSNLITTFEGKVSQCIFSWAQFFIQYWNNMPVVNIQILKLTCKLIFLYGK